MLLVALYLPHHTAAGGGVSAPSRCCAVLQWFEDLGGFEVEDNVEIFVQWAVKAVELFGSRITYWATFNEPTVRDDSCI